MEVVVLNFLRGRYSKATSGANFHDFLFWFFFFTKVDISQSKVLNLERLPSPFGAVLKFHCTMLQSILLLLFRPEFKQVDEQKKWKESAFIIKRNDKRIIWERLLS